METPNTLANAGTSVEGIASASRSWKEIVRCGMPTGVDVDVDYRCILCPGHISKGGLGSDIRVGTHTTKMAESGMGLCGRCQGPKTQSCE